MVSKKSGNWVVNFNTLPIMLFRKEIKMAPVQAEKRIDYLKNGPKSVIGPLEVYEMIRNNNDVNLIDVREFYDFSNFHIPGAINLPKRVWTSKFGLTSDNLNIIYSHSAQSSLADEAVKYFTDCGFSVVVLEGGVKQWQHYNLPVV